jgi:hypothetical protein
VYEGQTGSATFKWGENKVFLAAPSLNDIGRQMVQKQEVMNVVRDKENEIDDLKYELLKKGKKPSSESTSGFIFFNLFIYLFVILFLLKKLRKRKTVKMMLLKLMGKR